MTDISKLVLGKNESLLHQDNFKESYILEVRNTFKMGKENPEITLETNSQISIEQHKKGSSIFNCIKLNAIEGNTDTETMKPYLQQILVLAEISRIINVKRNGRGEFLSVENLADLRKDWSNWKMNKLKEVFASEKEQNKFILNYESGLEKFNDSFRNNLQYLFLLPEMYEIIFPPNQTYNYLYSPKFFDSRLVNGLRYTFEMKLVKLMEEDDETLSLIFHSVSIIDSVNQDKINLLYKNNDFNIEDFKFRVEITYLVNKRNSKILSGNFMLIEQLHENLSYTIDMNLFQNHYNSSKKN